MNAENYWINKDKLENQAIKVIADCLDSCITSNTLFSTREKVKDWINNILKIKAQGLISFDVNIITTDVVFVDGSSFKQGVVVNDYEDINVDII